MSNIELNKKRVVVAMSGGVDSCVAAVLLKEQGFEVIGITMQLWNHANSQSESRFDSCCSLSDVHDARRAADHIGIPHYLVNYEKEFKKGVVDYFAEEYAEGRTPNPCVMCNSKLKFDHLMDKAKALGAYWVATGHYAKIIHDETSSQTRLLRGNDSKKDQSYFLFSLKKEFLPRILFPLSEATKEEVRRIAEQYGLHTAKKHESQEICFVTGKRYSDFLDEFYSEKFTDKSGEIVDSSGNIIGQHAGIHKYTVGQRKGLHFAHEKPMFVKSIDASTNRIVVDTQEALATKYFRLGGFNTFVDRSTLENAQDLTIVVRYRSKPLAMKLFWDATNRPIVELASPAPWVTPGQAAVIYRGDEVLGGGFISTYNPPATSTQDNTKFSANTNNYQTIDSPQDGISYATQ